MTTVTAVTTPASRVDNLTPADYRDIYEELRDHLTLAQFIARAGSTVSPSWWSQYEAGVKHLNTARRNELRRAVGAPEIAPDVLTAVADVTPDASVWRVGTGAADRVIMVAPDAPETLNLRLNGGVYMDVPSDPQNAVEVPITPVIFDRRSPRLKYLRPCLSLDPAIRLRQLADLYAETLQAVSAADSERAIAVWQEPDDPEDYEPNREEQPHAV